MILKYCFNSHACLERYHFWVNSWRHSSLLITPNSPNRMSNSSLVIAELANNCAQLLARESTKHEAFPGKSIKEAASKVSGNESSAVAKVSQLISEAENQKIKRPGAKEIECLVEWEKGELARDAGWDGSWIGWLFLAKSNAAFFGSVVHVITNGACAIFRLA